MPQDFATLTETKRSLRILETETDDDALLEMLITAASKSVANYLKSSADSLLPNEAEIPAEVRVATIMLVGYLYRSPDEDPDKYFERGFLPAPVTALLYPLRDPAVA